MKARCPRDESHKKFTTVAHVMEEWTVDEHGNWLQTEQCLETVHGPDPDNEWVCLFCGAVAVVEG